MRGREARTRPRIWSRPKCSDADKSEEERKVKEETTKVLVVEDNAFNIVPITATLGKNAVAFDIAKNGMMAVDRYEQTMREGYF